MLFIAGVANVTMMEGDTIVATAQTLVDSSITIGLTFEDVRGGMSNKLYGRYGHDASFDLKITDAMFSLDYIAMNTGSEVTIGGDCLKTEQLTANAGGTLTLSSAPQPFFGSTAYVYYKKVGAAGGFNKVAADSTTVTVGEAGDYCVRYMYNNSTASKIVVDSAFIPKTLSLLMEANLYSGGNCSDVSNATLAGKMLIKVPRFMLNGSQEISMTASGVSQTSLEGSALAYGCEGCNDKSYYAEIVQVMESNPIAAIVVEDANKTAHVADVITVEVYACPSEGAPVKLQPSQFTVSPDTSETPKWTVSGNKVTIAAGATGTLNIGVEAFDKTAALKVTVVS